MLYANVTSCPVWGGDVKSYNADAIMKMPGVHSVVPLPFNAKNRAAGFLSGGVGVVADAGGMQKKALDAMPIEWDYGPHRNVSSASLYADHLAEAKKEGVRLTDDGNVDEAFSRAAKIVESAAACSPRARMEPGDATVLVTENRLDAWTGDQNPQQFLRYAADLTGVAPENTYVHATTFQGGGYGNGGNGDQGQKAVAVANAVRGIPVKMLWTREEDWARGTKYRPMSVCVMKAGLDAQGWPIAMEVRHSTTWTGDMGFRDLCASVFRAANYTGSGGHAEVPAFPRARRCGGRSAKRSMESFIDELANTVGKDSYEYRRELLFAKPTPA